MRKWIIGLVLSFVCISPSLARKQWTEKEAWKWQERVGVVKGFNEMIPAYPGMTLDEILKTVAVDDTKEKKYKEVCFLGYSNLTDKSCPLTVISSLAIPKLLSIASATIKSAIF